HCSLRNIDVLDLTLERLRKLFSHRAVRQSLGTSQVIRLSRVSCSGQSRRSYGCNIAYIYRTDPCVAGSSKEFSLRYDCVSKNEQALHKQVRTQQRIVHP